MGTIILLNFDEPEDALGAADETGNLVDLLPEIYATALTTPAVVAGLGGYARRFGDGDGLGAFPAVADVTELRRDLTVEAIVSPDLVNGFADGVNGTIIAKGQYDLGGQPEERTLFGLRLVPTAADLARLELFWQVAGPADASVPGVEFKPPAGWLYLVAVREWISTSEVRVSYYAQGRLLLEAVSTDGDIAEGGGGELSVGAWTSSTAFGFANVEEFYGDIDRIRVSDDAMSAEEIAYQWRRMNVHAPAGAAIMRSLMPDGDPLPPYSEDPASEVGRELIVAGDALGEVYASAERLLDGLPDRAWDPVLAQWEKILQLRVQASDTIGDRRARVAAHMAQARGFATGDIRELFAELLDQLAADVDLRRYSNLFTHDFSTGLDPEFWRHPGNGTIDDEVTTAAAGSAGLHCAAAADLRWDADNVEKACIALRGIAAGAAGSEISAELNDTGSVAAGAIAGVLMVDQVTHELIVAGVRGTDGSTGYWRYVDGVSSWTQILAGSDDPIYVRLVHKGSGLYRIYLNGAGLGYDPPYDSTTDDIAGPREPGFCGFGLVGEVAAAGASSIYIGGAATGTAVRIWQPNGRRPYIWNIYRDLALAGSPDLEAARALFRRVKPTHTDGVVTDDLSFQVGDDPLGLVPFKLS